MKHRPSLSHFLSTTLPPRPARPCAPPAPQTKPEKAHLARSGLDLITGAIRNNVEAGVLEPALAKLKIIQVRCGVWAQAQDWWQWCCWVGLPPSPPGLNLTRGAVCPQFATEAAITILRIDDLIKLAPEEQEGEEE